MTKFILVGGYPFKTPDNGKTFCEEVIKGFEKPVKLLECLFSRPRDSWDKAFSEEKNTFASNLGETSFEMRLADTENFIEQVKWANAIYFRGGDPDLLIATLRRTGEWAKELNKKTIAGSSAGADMIAKHYCHLDKISLADGLGFLPIKVLVHWKSDYGGLNIDWDRLYAELGNYKEDLPILTLKEGEFVVRTA